MLSSADLHVGNLDLGEVLPMPCFASVAAASSEPEDPNLLALAVPHHFGGHFGAFDFGGSRLDGLAITREEHLIERDFVPWLRSEQRDLDRHTGLGAELAATGGEDCVCHRARNLNGQLGLVTR